MMRLPIAITVAVVVCAVEVAVSGYQNDPKRGQDQLQAQAPEPPWPAFTGHAAGRLRVHAADRPILSTTAVQ